MAAKPISRRSTAPRPAKVRMAKADRKGAPARTAGGKGGVAWSGRFAEPVSERVKRYTASVGFDKRLAAHDIRASIAHARMLRAAGILSASDLRAIAAWACGGGLLRIASALLAARVVWSISKAEDGALAAAPVPARPDQ